MSWEIRQGDALERLREMEPESVQTVVTSPPYWGLRDYGDEGQLGLEPTPEQYVANLVEVFREIRRVLRKDGTVWLNLGDSYNGSSASGGLSAKQASNSASAHARPLGTFRSEDIRRVPGLKPKDLCGIPWRVAFALQADGWWLRSDIIWSKSNPMPESVTDRPTRAHEYLFLLTKSARYFMDMDAIREEHEMRPQARPNGRPISEVGRLDDRQSWPMASRAEAGVDGNPAGRNKRSVWEIATAPYPEAHFATFPPKLVEPCILAGSAKDDTVLDCFCGSGTTGVVALRHDRSFIGIELNESYCELARNRIREDAPLLNAPLEVAA